MAQAWIGTSGWSYKHWAKVFYPDKLPAIYSALRVDVTRTVLGVTSQDIL